MARSPVMSNDINQRQEFKEQTLRRIYDAINSPVKVTSKGSMSKGVIVKGLQPPKKEN